VTKKSKFFLPILTTVLLSGSAQAQYTGSNQTNTISGVTSNWVGAYIVGDTWVYDALVIQTGGVLSNTYGYIGNQSGASNNSVLVNGSGSVWSNANDLAVGNFGAANSLTITNKGAVLSEDGYVGFESDYNTALVTGSGSVWKNVTNLYVGYAGAPNSLTIAGSGTVYNAFGYIGYEVFANFNTVLVTDPGSVWSNGNDLAVGSSSSGNSLTITNGSMVLNGGNGYIGNFASSDGNVVLVAGSGSVWSCGANLAVGNNGGGNSLTVAGSGTVYDVDGIIGEQTGANNSTVLVTDPGSVWSNAGNLSVGLFGGANSLTVSNGGKVTDYNGGILGGVQPGNNTALITGNGSVWSNTLDLYVGATAGGDSLIITNGAAVTDGGDGLLGGGYSAGSNNTVLVSGNGSVWDILGVLYVGMPGSSNQLVIGTGGTVIASSAVIGLGFNGQLASNNVLQIDGGSLFVTNSSGNGQLSVGQSTGSAALILNSGSVTVNQITLLNGLNSVVTFNAGILNSGGTVVTTPQNFTVGDGSDAAIFHLLDGEHSFINGALEISSNAFLTGCGDINGNVLIDIGGAVLADCGGTLTIFGSVTNNGNIVATNGTTINFYGPVVNNGQIGPTNSVHYYPIPPSSGVTNSWLSPTSGKWEAGFDWSAGPPSIIQPAVYVTNASSKTVTIDVITAIAYTNTLTISNLTVSGPGGSTNTLLLNAMGASAPLQVVSNLNVNTGGIVSVTNSALEIDSSGAIPVTNGLFIGINSAGEQLSIHGGQVSDDRSWLGYNSSSGNNAVLVTGSGSVWSNSSILEVGVNGSGNSLTITNGGVVYSNGGAVGNSSSANNNSVLVTGSGSVWSNADELYLGYAGSGNSLTLANGGIMYDGDGYIGENIVANNNTVLVTDPGSVWSNAGSLLLGLFGAGNSLTITNGAVVMVGGEEADIGVFQASSSNNLVTVSGNGAVCDILGTLIVGDQASGNQVVIGTGGSVVASQAYVSISIAAQLNDNVIQVNGGSLFVTNALGTGALVVGYGVASGSLILNSGSVTVNQLALTNGANSVIAFNAGTLASGGTFVTNNQLFVVGDGTDAATFQLNGGIHSFANNLEISSNAFLIGCATIEGNVTIDPGGTVLANCGGMLTFTGIVTNNGTMQAVDGSVLQAYGLVVNNGVINVINGSTEFLGGLVNNGVVLTETDVQISSITRSGNNITIQIPSVNDATYQLQFSPSLKPTNWTDVGASQGGTGGVLTFGDSGGATNRPGRFYRIDITLP
jgi:T5SS/PEP-CTERM-associated repeat protein